MYNHKFPFVKIGQNPRLPTTAALCKVKSCSQACSVTNGSASCSCYNGYTLSRDTQCSDINESTSGNKPCSQSCQNTDGGFLCSCYPGYKLDQDGVSCTICDQPYFGYNCSCACVCNGHGTCNNVRGCECKSGWTGSNCNQDVDECVNDGACTSGEICVNNLGSYQCQCPTGYTRKETCTDINECLDVLDNNCDLSVEDCVNNVGSYPCVCRKGYTRNRNNICQDIDEFTTQTHNCEQICENTPGNFNCKCNYGYTIGTDRTSCVKRDIVCDLKCDHICTIAQGTDTPYCLCKSGYSLKGNVTCQNINECEFNHLNLCDKKDNCVNTLGGYKCSCLPGYFLDNNGCSCIACGAGKWGPECSNDCACGNGAESCDPKRGCICKPGFAGTHCERDIDECSTGLLICQAGEKCVNTFGSASCQCLDGYSKVDGKCQDIDECKLNLDGCEQNCDNTNGGYQCSCREGLKLNADGVSCVVTDECVPNPYSDKCAVVNGNPVCFCPKGKQLDANNKSLCNDADMCQGNSCSDGCQETIDGSSFQCTCPSGKKLAADGITCTDCLSGTYGLNCSNKCSCNATNTKSCDKINGQCICKPGWLSATCDVDKDECQDTSTCSSPFKCVNAPGSYVCKCNPGYYTSNSQCLDNSFGEECKNQCQCDLSHSSCDKVTGQCTCHTGWTGALCDKDINECDSSDNDCVTIKRVHWICIINSPGSYKCDCASGYQIVNDNCVDLDECAGDFSNQCDGYCTNTAGSYICSCGSGYKLASDGHTCQDIDECQQGTSGCQQKCNNEVGSYSCSCGAGYDVDETNNKKCYKSVGYGFQVKLLMDVTGKNLKEKLGQDYINLKAVIEAALKMRIKVKVTGLKQLLINSMRQGSVIVDFTTSIEDITDVNAASKMVEAILQIAETGLVVDGTHQDAIVTVGNITVPPTKDKCLILEALEPCKSEEKCQLNGDGEAYCKSTEEELNIPFIVGLSVGLPLAVGLIVAIVACIIYKKKYQTQRRINVREGNYLEHPGTPDSSVKPSIAPSSFIITPDKEKLFPEP